MMEYYSLGTLEQDVKIEEMDIKTEYDNKEMSYESDNQFNAVIFGTAKHNTQNHREIFKNDYIINVDIKTDTLLTFEPQCGTINTQSETLNTQSETLDTQSEILSTQSDTIVSYNTQSDTPVILYTQTESLNTQSETLSTQSETLSAQSETLNTKSDTPVILYTQNGSLLTLDLNTHKGKKIREKSLGKIYIKNEHGFNSKESNENILKHDLQYRFDHEIVVKNEIDLSEHFFMDSGINYEEENLADEVVTKEISFTCKESKTKNENHKRNNVSNNGNKNNAEISIKEEILSDNETITEFNYKEGGPCSETKENIKTRKETRSKIQKNVKTRKENISKIQGNQETSLLVPIHDKNTYICNDCGYKFNHLGNLRRHIGRRHTPIQKISKIPPLSCLNCAYKCSNKSTLERHIKKHKDKPYACHICTYSTRHRYGLNRHLKTHTGEKKFICEICDKKCTTKRGLDYHVMIHSGEKPFSCDKCDFKAVNKHDIIRHGRIHTGEKPFSCEICGYSCVRKYHLSLHMRKHVRESTL